MHPTNPTVEHFRKIVNDFTGIRAMIIGDVMIDTYLRGKVDRISPEAPVPVVALQQRENMLGGAANVALNLQSLGAVPVLCSVIGDDNQGKEFLDLLKKEGINDNGILISNERITTTKYRIIGNRVQMLRVDHETDQELDTEHEMMFMELIIVMMEQQKPSVIILQDYNKGVLTPYVIEGVIQQALLRNIPVVVDPKKKNFSLFHSVALFKPNLKEIREGLQLTVDPFSKESLDQAAHILHNQQKASLVMITLSEEGVFISDRKESQIIRAHKRSIADVSGAGDTVISVAALCIALNVSPPAMASIANLAGGLVCERVGVVPVEKEALLEGVISLTA